MSSSLTEMKSLSDELTSSRVGQALAEATNHLVKSRAPELVGVTRGTPANWEKGNGIDPLRWLAIGLRSRPANVYGFLQALGIKPTLADEVPPESEFHPIAAELGTMWNSEEGRRKITAALELLGLGEFVPSPARASPRRDRRAAEA